MRSPCHGWRWEQHYTHGELSRERDAIAKTVEAITTATPACVRSAGIPSRPRPSTPVACSPREFGFLYDSDAYNDDLPYFVDVEGHPVMS